MQRYSVGAAALFANRGAKPTIAHCWRNIANGAVLLIATRRRNLCNRSRRVRHRRGLDGHHRKPIIVVWPHRLMRHVCCISHGLCLPYENAMTQGDHQSFMWRHLMGLTHFENRRKRRDVSLYQNQWTEMKAHDTDIPIDLLRERLSYNPQTGILVWRSGGRWNRLRGKRAGSRNTDGYVVVAMKIDGVRRFVYAHRIAFALVHGRWPADEIDHIKGKSNRFANLREATHAQNMQNTWLKQLPQSGLRGVYRSGSRWQAKTQRNGKRIYLGSFATKQEAERALLAAITRALNPDKPASAEKRLARSIERSRYE